MRIRTRHHQDGMAVIVVLALLAILLSYLCFNILTLQRLKQEVKMLEKRQVQRLQSPGTSTNAIAPPH